MFGINFKRNFLFKSALSGAGSDQLPSWDDFVKAIFWQVYAFLFFYNSLFPEMAVQDEQYICRTMTIVFQNRFNRCHHFSIGFTQLSNLLQPLAILFNQFPNYVFFISFRQLSAKIDCCRKYLDDVPK